MEVALFVSIFCVIAAGALDIKDIVITISSQSNKYHQHLAEDLKKEIHEQARSLKREPPIVHLSHEDFPHVGGWTILPLIPYLMKLHRKNCSWFFFAEDRTRIKLNKLVKTFQNHNYEKEIWLGYTMQDKEPTIIHHFAFFEDPGTLKYPNTLAGFAISKALMERLEDRWKNRDLSTSDFSIDHAYELALFIWNKNEGSALKHESTFCISEQENCATFPLPFSPCEKLIPEESMYFAVKTCQKFHKDRVHIVKRTWGQQASRLYFFSDIEDTSIPTISVEIPNTERGHCGKTMAIIRRVSEHIREDPSVKWIVIADDDTILSVARLQQLLTCYDSTTPVALGERYGYNIHNKQGYNYITGGGGIVLSRVLLDKLGVRGTCKCPSISSPDDMFLGVCIARLGVDITHSPLFHQARPMDYAPEYLKNQPAVSFHKHWMVDPISVYDKWFAKADLQISADNKHSEL
ncbi:hypothetical protein ILUMI_07878 [Ignelater luminosus]|uniref:Fringe-like glycosyltransferase domain-containing protein n=1 Tax=Ignelater luminosus TaxID=2038154 RepID=A0A8K0D781_IGNLU|nr:hypothetical protein ILUMI_07878 [Ignelater luminosus]